MDKLLDYLDLQSKPTYTVSIALCTYNGAKYIREQLDSILNQNYPIDEIVICDDGSTDGTIEIIKEYLSHYPNIIKLHINETNLKTINNFEKAINLCTKDIIFLCDQDDVWYHHKVKFLIKYFDNNPNTKAVFHDIDIFFGNSAKIENYSMWDSLSYSSKVRDKIPLYEFLCLFGNVVTGMALAIRKPDVPIDFCTADDKYFLHDYQLALHYAVEDSIKPLSLSLGKYRQHDDQQLGCNTNASRIDYVTHYEDSSLRYSAIRNQINIIKRVNTKSKNRLNQLEWLNKEKKTLVNSKDLYKSLFLRTTNRIKKKTIYPIVKIIYRIVKKFI